MNEIPSVTPGLSLPQASLAGSGRIAWSALGGYARLLCRVVAVVVFGLLLNWGFLAFAAWRFGAAADIQSGTVLLLFGAMFPLAYLVVGQKQGMQVLLRHCYARHESSVTDGLLILLQRLKETTGPAISGDTMRTALKTMDEMSWPVRFAMRHFFKQQSLQMLALEIAGGAEFRSGNLAATKERYAPQVKECILKTLLTLDTRWFRLLASANVIAVGVLWCLMLGR